MNHCNEESFGMNRLEWLAHPCLNALVLNGFGGSRLLANHHVGEGSYSHVFEKEMSCSKSSFQYDFYMTQVQYVLIGRHVMWTI